MTFEISLSPEKLDDDFSSGEECATFGLLRIGLADMSLTEGFSYYLGGSRTGPMIAGSSLAEWLAWNWWRLAYEPKLPKNSMGDDHDIMWGMAHCMASAGDGYVWPNITVSSDGFRTLIISEPSEADAKPYRYFGAHPVVLPTEEWIGAVDKFMSQTIERLSAANQKDANAVRLWNDIRAERNDPETSKVRRLQALMGHEPDEESDEAAIKQLIADANRLGDGAITEVAASQAGMHSADRPPMTAEDFESVAAHSGFDADTKDAVCLDEPAHADHNIQPWRIGYDAAQALRRQVGNEGGLINNRTLAEFAGAPGGAVENNINSNREVSFYLDGADEDSGGRIALCPRHPNGRRFDLARVVGDRLCYSSDKLLPATKAKTYRQRFQRAFAGELLCPFNAIDERLSGDYEDQEQCDEIAREFQVSPQVIQHQLMNHGRIERDFDDMDFRATAG